MAFDAEVEILTEFTSDPDDPKATAKACFTAAIVYACFLGFCGCQVSICFQVHVRARQ
jgi:ribonuclease kappa